MCQIYWLQGADITRASTPTSRPPIRKLPRWRICRCFGDVLLEKGGDGALIDFLQDAQDKLVEFFFGADKQRLFPTDELNMSSRRSQVDPLSHLSNLTASVLLDFPIFIILRWWHAALLVRLSWLRTVSLYDLFFVELESNQKIQFQKATS